MYLYGDMDSWWDPRSGQSPKDHLHAQKNTFESGDTHMAELPQETKRHAVEDESRASNNSPRNKSSFLFRGMRNRGTTTKTFLASFLVI